MVNFDENPDKMIVLMPPPPRKVLSHISGDYHVFVARRKEKEPSKWRQSLQSLIEMIRGDY